MMLKLNTLEEPTQKVLIDTTNLLVYPDTIKGTPCVVVENSFTVKIVKETIEEIEAMIQAGGVINTELGNKKVPDHAVSEDKLMGVVETILTEVEESADDTATLEDIATKVCILAYLRGVKDGIHPRSKHEHHTATLKTY